MVRSGHLVVCVLQPSIELTVKNGHHYYKYSCTTAEHQVVFKVIKGY